MKCPSCKTNCSSRESNCPACGESLRNDDGTVRKAPRKKKRKRKQELEIPGAVILGVSIWKFIPMLVITVAVVVGGVFTVRSMYEKVDDLITPRDMTKVGADQLQLAYRETGDSIEFVFTNSGKGGLQVAEVTITGSLAEGESFSDDEMAAVIIHTSGYGTDNVKFSMNGKPMLSELTVGNDQSITVKDIYGEFVTRKPVSMTKRSITKWQRGVDRGDQGQWSVSLPKKKYEKINVKIGV